MPTVNSDWKYYIPSKGMTPEHARPIPVYDWHCIYDAEDAAERAAKDDWENQGGYESGEGDGPNITVISPDGNETKFSVSREYVVTHNVYEINESNYPTARKQC